MVREPGDLSHQAAAPGSGEILNRDSEPGSGNNSTLDNLFLPGFLVPIVKSDRAVHNPPPQHQLGWDEGPLTSRWNASESLQHRPQIPS